MCLNMLEKCLLTALILALMWEAWRLRQQQRIRNQIQKRFPVLRRDDNDLKRAGEDYRRRKAK
jgi:hypothetical protein